MDLNDLTALLFTGLSVGIILSFFPYVIGSVVNLVYRKLIK